MKNKLYIIICIIITIAVVCFIRFQKWNEVKYWNDKKQVTIENYTNFEN